jgi:hypothetical protein
MAKSTRRIHGTQHRFLDEAGDSTFYGKGKRLIVGENGVSLSFMIGMLKIKEPLDRIRKQVEALQMQIANDFYFADIPSIQKKKNKLYLKRSTTARKMSFMPIYCLIY